MKPAAPVRRIESSVGELTLFSISDFHGESLQARPMKVMDFITCPHPNDCFVAVQDQRFAKIARSSDDGHAWNHCEASRSRASFHRSYLAAHSGWNSMSSSGCGRS